MHIDNLEHWGRDERGIHFQYLDLEQEEPVDRSERGPESDRYDLHALQEIILEASRIQHERLDTLSRAELEEIAAELQITPGDVAKAIEIVRKHGALKERYGVGRLQHPALAVLAVGAAGSVVATLVNSLPAILTQPYMAYTALASLVCLVCAEAALAYSVQGKHKHVRFQLANLGLWGGWTSVLFLVGHPEAAVPGIFIGAMAAVFGSLLITSREDGSHAPDGGVVRALRRWVSRDSSGPASRDHEVFRASTREALPRFSSDCCLLGLSLGPR